jgi:membrane-bound lytic murein transglycosylase D
MVMEPAAATKPAESRTVPATVAPLPSAELDQRINRAQERFQAGKRMLQEGDKEGARQAFDRAVEILLSGPADDNQARTERRLEELVDLIYRYDVDELGAGEAQDKVAFDKSPLDEIRDMNFPLDPKMKGLVEHHLNATASQLPLEMNDTVLSFVNYFSASKLGRNTLVNGWRRAGRYRPMIEKILAEEGVPQELIFLAQAESGFLPRAISRKAAAGMWQFVSWRGKEYGLDQSSYYDLRLDPERATRAAAKHLKDLYMQFGDWHLALAAYNCGPGCVDRAVQRTGFADYWKLRNMRAIPHETTNYVPIIMAMTIVTRNAKDYGIVLDDPAPSLEYDSLTLKTNTNIDLIADAADLPVSSVRDLNPALLRNIAPAGYELRLPKGQANEVETAMEMVPAAQRAAWRLHRVKEGENLNQIAQRYRTSPKSILTANNDVSSSVEAGDVLVVPAAYVEPAVKRSSKTKAAVHAVAKSGKTTSRTAKPTYRTTGKRASAK